MTKRSSIRALLASLVVLVLHRHYTHGEGEDTVSSASIAADGSVGVHVDNILSSSSSLEYGVDISWPMHHHHRSIASTPPSLGGDVNNMDSHYHDYMLGCRYQYPSDDLCEQYERDRIEMNLEQPPAMINYTSAGFAKLRAPTQVQALLTQFWYDHEGMEQVEAWPPGNVYTNHWSAPSKILNLANDSLVGAAQLRRRLVEQVGSILEAWTGQPLTPTSLYGIRIYQDGAILAPHVDRLPLVTSAIINVAQDADEPWVLEVIDHSGKAHNITMEPGDMVLYESHSVIHGRPFRFQGRYYANVFLHFEPYGYTERHAQRAAPFSVKADASARKLWDEAQQRQRHRAEEQTSSSKRRYSIPKLPHYIQEGTPEATRWQQMYAFQRDDVAILDNPKKKQESTKAKEVTMHAAAANGDLERIKELAAKDRSLLFYVDENGWQPLHEAARAGQTLVVEYLLAEGADLNARTNRGFGATPLWWAEQSLTPDHPTVKILRQLNAIKQGPMEEVEETAKDAE